MKFRKEVVILDNNKQLVCNTIKKMTLEEFATLLGSLNYSGNQIKEEFSTENEMKNEKIIFNTEELINNYSFFTRYNINKAIQKDGLPFFKIGNKKMFNKEEIDKWIEKESKIKNIKQKFDI